MKKEKYTDNKLYFNEAIERQLKGNWRVGDTCIHEYKVKVVKEVRPDGMVSNLSDGYIEGGGLDNRDEMFPITTWTLRLSQSIQYQDKELRELDRLNLNWPDIHRKFREFCIEGCALCFEDFESYEDCERRFEDFNVRLGDFTNKIKEKCAEIKNNTVHGVKVFGR
jgi:hypothetical protein